MNDGFNLDLIYQDGYLVIPLSMARLTKGQSPEKTYKIFHYFSKKLASYSSDVVLLYTGGLYFNNENVTYKDRTKTNEQQIIHSTELRKLIDKKKEFIPRAFHFIPIDYVALNSEYFDIFFKKLKQHVKIDDKFKKCVEIDMGERPYNEANENFILEEVVVSHIIKERLVEFPRTLVKNDMWRLIAYPGSYMESDRYQWVNDILPKKDKTNPFRGAQYDFNNKKLFVYSDA